MTIQELLESAQLDALGLLDEQDRDAFERAFQAAPEALQKQIRREQERLCRMDALLPQVDLPDTLWPKVKDAVRAAQAAAIAEVEGAGLATSVRPFPMSRSAGVHRVWRAAAIGFATAAVVLGAVTIHLRMTAESQVRLAVEAVIADQTREGFGPEYLNEILYGRPMHYVMSPAREGVRGDAAVFTHPKWKDSAILYCSAAAPEGKTLRLVELNEDGSIGRQFAEFESAGAQMRRKVNLEGAEPKKLALVAAPRGQPASTGEIILKIA
jgi:hypothetical protein